MSDEAQEMLTLPAFDLVCSLEVIEHVADPAAFAGRGLIARSVNWIAYGVLRFGAVALAGGRDY